MPGNKYLVLNLEGPMQSWGLNSWFDLRTSETLPTKSGVIGMIAAAFGLSRGDTQGIARLSALKMAAVCIQEGKLESDFHTIGAGYDKHPDRVLFQVPTSDKKTKTVVTHREYLNDYKFKVILWGNNGLLEECSKVILDPKWGGFLGRKGCYPVRPLVDGIFEGADQVKDFLNASLKLVSEKTGTGPRPLKECRVLCETDSSDGELRQDVPVTFIRRNGLTDVVRRVSSELVLDW